MTVFFFHQNVSTNVFEFKTQHISIVSNLVYVVFQRNNRKVFDYNDTKLKVYIYHMVWFKIYMQN